MTNRKAIGILEVMKSAGELMLVEDEQEALDIAIQSLEKQEPKKPIRDEIEDIIRCPNCKSSMLMDNVCFKCGQALDWVGYKNDK